ncbi:hypothetical protein EA58_01730 [Photobacterium galatheae]|uniref:Uncharacterized protein n=1 Tax=Photobacterium galatheae TaxID=1654360 RepID=A0A066RW68_9GAMM|nr:hypothetical protein EA58_01730 [Photobacterium galatheae]
MKHGRLTESWFQLLCLAFYSNHDYKLYPRQAKCVVIDRSGRKGLTCRPIVLTEFGWTIRIERLAAFCQFQMQPWKLRQHAHLYHQAGIIVLSSLKNKLAEIGAF